MDEFQALHAFMSRFGWKVYDASTVPDDALEKSNGHYITYSPATGGLDDPVFMSISLWHRSTSWAEITQKTLEIRDYVGYAGVTVPYDYGFIRITRGAPFSQRMPDEDDTIRRIYINFNLEFLTNK